VALGGTLYQDIRTQIPESGEHRTEDYEKHRHTIRFVEGSSLEKLYPHVDRANVTSIHHQSIKTIGRGLRIEAFSEPDGVVEAVRGEGKGYIFAVQWHPEFHNPADRALLDCAPILESFLEAARAG
jgi:gamma-glutamyl-gamma-aminobutyrate hydrolase PuuD